FTGRPMKRMHSLKGLTRQQIVTRVEWFVAELKNYNVIPQTDNIHCRDIALQNKDH
ncbi:Hypothetical predicted protein, partial [Pelobates cultripes]